MGKFIVATEFSRTPSARTENEGKNPGEKLRKILVPLLMECISQKEQLIVDLDGTAGYGTSFLEEVFGGLIREEKFKYQDLKDYLDFISEEEPDLIDEIWQDIEDAHENETH